MTRFTRRLLRALPLIVLLGAAGAWTLLGAPNRDRADAEESIRLRWEAPADTAATTKSVDAYLARYGDDPTAAWFAAEAYGHLRKFDAAVRAITTRPAAKEQSQAPRRLARLLLEALSTTQGDASKPTLLWTRVLHARLDARDADGERAWREYIPRLQGAEVMSFFMPGQRTPSRATVALGEGMKSRSNVRELALAGAILLAGPKHADDVPTLVENFHSSWRDERRPTWHQIARALGATGDPRAVAALREEAGQASDDKLLSNRRAVDVGLAIAGDREARERVLATAGQPGAFWYLQIYCSGLSARLSQGDEAAVPRLLELWDRTSDLASRLQFGLAVLLSDPSPPAAFDRWADAMVTDPELVSRVVGHAWRFRRGKDPAFGPLADDFVAAATSVDLTSPPSIEHPEVSTAIEVLRAWLRWGD